MTPHQVALVQASFETVKPLAAEVADLFYGRLFATAPALRPLFPADMSGQKGKLVAALALAVANLHRAETVVPVLEELGRRHAGYGVADAHYDAVGAALIWTLEQGLGAAFTAEVREAWGATYALVAETMKAASAGPMVEAA